MAKKRKRKVKKRPPDPSLLSALEEAIPGVQFRTDSTLPKFLRRPTRGIAPVFEKIALPAGAPVVERQKGITRDVVIPPFRSIFKVDPFATQGAGLPTDF